MTTKTQIEDALVAWLELMTPSMKPFVADQNAPQTPDGDLFCSIRLQNMEKIGLDETRGPDGTGISQHRGNREFMVYLSAHREGAFDALCALRDSLDLNSVHDLFVAAGFIPVDSEPVLNTTEVEQQSMVEAGSLDIRFRLGVDIADSVGLIERVEIEATAEVIEDVSITTEINIGTAYTPPEP